MNKLEFDENKCRNEIDLIIINNYLKSGMTDFAATNEEIDRYVSWCKWQFTRDQEIYQKLLAEAMELRETLSDIIRNSYDIVAKKVSSKAQERFDKFIEGSK